MSKKVIFFDIDGTLYAGESKGITEKVISAIKKTRDLGHLCFVASGRPYGFIADNVKEIGFDGYVLANGANIKYHDKDLEARYMNKENVQEFIQCLKEKNIEYVLQTTTYCYLRKECTSLLEFYKKCNIDFKNFQYDYDEQEVINRVVKMEVFGKTQEEVDYVVKNCKAFSYEIHPDMQSMEIYSSTVSKATGIRDVLKDFDIDVKDSYCFGDGPNDVEMFETVGHAIAMGNAIDIIKEKADEICLSVYEDGVAYKLEELFFKS